MNPFRLLKPQIPLVSYTIQPYFVIHAPITVRVPNLVQVFQRFLVTTAEHAASNNQLIIEKNTIKLSNQFTLKHLETKYLNLISRVSLRQFRLELQWLITDYYPDWPVENVENFKFSIITKQQQNKIITYLDERDSGVPMQYILGYTQYLGFKFYCKSPILIPRPETEQMCEWIIYQFYHIQNYKQMNKKWAENVPIQFSSVLNASDIISLKPLKMVDLCCGSGNIALVLAASIKSSQCIGIDINPEAIQLSQQNKISVNNQLKQKLSNRSLHCDFQLADLLDPNSLTSHFHSIDLIVSNPPYLSAHEFQDLQPEIKDYEDSRALIAADNGLQFYSLIIQQAHNLLIPVTAKSMNDRNYYCPEVVLEIGAEWQTLSIRTNLIDNGFKRIEFFKDWNDKIRWVAASRIPAQ